MTTRELIRMAIKVLERKGPPQALIEARGALYWLGVVERGILKDKATKAKGAIAGASADSVQG